MNRIGGRGVGRVGRWAIVLCAVGLAVPADSSATTFSFGSIGPGASIASIVLAPGSPTVSFSTATNELMIEAAVSTINLGDGTSLSIPLGDVMLSSQLTMLPGSLSFAPPFASTLVTAAFSNGLVPDLTLIDVAGGIAMLDADYVGSLAFFTSQPIPGIVSGSLSADFAAIGGDADFVAAWGAAGSFNALLTGYQTGGVPVSSLCALVLPNCFPAQDLKDFTANPVITMIPIPEPGVALLLGGGVVLAVFARKR